MDLSNIPECMKNRDQWCLWRYKYIEGKKPKKPPYSALTGKQFNVVDEDMYTDFISCVTKFNEYDGYFNGIGFCLIESDPYFVIDYDDLNEREYFNKHINHINKIDSYIEYSPSKTGVHAIFYDNYNGYGIVNREDNIEIYTRARYITMTGDIYKDKSVIKQHKEATNYYLNKYKKEIETSNVTENFIDAFGRCNKPTKYSDKQVLKNIRESPKSSIIKMLWNGENKDNFGSQSEMDQTFMNILVTFSPNYDQCARIFRMSKIGQRNKAKRDDYLKRTFVRACDQFLLQTHEVKLIGEEYEIEATPVFFSQAEYESINGLELTNDNGPHSKCPSGMFSKLCNFLHDRGVNDYKSATIVSAMSILSGVFGKSYSIGGTALNEYFLFSALTATCKNRVNSAPSDFKSYLEGENIPCPNFIPAKGFTNNKSVYNKLKETPCILWNYDDGANIVDMLNDPRDACNRSLRDFLLTGYSSSGKNDVILGNSYADEEKNVENIKAPSISAVFNMTVERLWDNLDTRSFEDGLMNRFLIVEDYKPFDGKKADEQYQIIDENGEIINKEKLESKVKIMPKLLKNVLANMIGNIEHIYENGPIEICLTREAAKIKDDYADHINGFRTDQVMKGENGFFLSAVHGRSILHVMKISGLVAILDRPSMPVITKEIILWAINYVTRSNQITIKKHSEGKLDETSDDWNECQVIENIINEYRSLSEEKLQSLRINPLYKEHNLIPHTYIYNKIRWNKHFKKDKRGVSMALSSVINILKDNGTIKELDKNLGLSQFSVTAKLYIYS